MALRTQNHPRLVGTFDDGRRLRLFPRCILVGVKDSCDMRGEVLLFACLAFAAFNAVNVSHSVLHNFENTQATRPTRTSATSRDYQSVTNGDVLINHNHPHRGRPG